jgi:hypothetical protein
MRDYAANMGSTAAEPSEHLRSASKEFAGVLRSAVSDGLDTDELTELLKVAFTQRNQMDAAVSSAVGALDRAVAKAPGGELTAGLSCAAWLSQNLHISSSAGYA